MSDSKTGTDPEAPTPVEGPRVVVTGKGPNLCYGVCVEVDGTVYGPDGHKPLALCACGLSDNMPWCSGNHKALYALPDTLPDLDADAEPDSKKTTLDPKKDDDV